MNKFYCLLFLFSYCFASNYYRSSEEAHETIRCGLVDLRDGDVAKGSCCSRDMLGAATMLFGGKLNLTTEHTQERRKEIAYKKEEIDNIQRQRVKSREDLQANLRKIEELTEDIKALEGKIRESEYGIIKLEYEKRFPCQYVKIGEALRAEFYKQAGEMTRELHLEKNIRIAPIDEDQIKEVDQLFPQLPDVSFADYGHPDMAQDKSFDIYSENGISRWKLFHPERCRYWLKLRMISRLSAAAAAVSSSKQEPQSPEKQKLPKTKKAECVLL